MSLPSLSLRPADLLRSAPILLPQLLAILVLVILSAPEGGYPLEDWAPAAILVQLLLLVALLTLPGGPSRPAGSTLAIVALAGLTIWSALSISWADDAGVAATATTRTALLAAAFALFARWRQPATTALVAVAVATIGLGLTAWATVFSLRAATDIDPWFLYDRLLEPVGYVNAGAAFWGITAFLGMALISGRLHPALRLVGAAIAPAAAALSLLCLSRGGLLSTAVVLILMLALLPGRARTLGGALIVGTTLLTAVPVLLDVGDAARLSPDAADTLHAAMDRTMLATLLAVALTALWAWAEHRLGAEHPLRARMSRAGAAALLAAAVLGLGLFATGTGPVTPSSVSRAADSITSVQYDAVGAGTNRLTAGLSSGRWQFWTVAWDQFTRHPWHGAGADNFRQDFLLAGKGVENPAYPHSLQLRMLGQLGLIGGVLLLGWLLPAIWAIWRLARVEDPAARALAGALAGGMGLWIVHGSVDWLLEYGGMTAIIGGLTGLAFAASPRSTRAPRRTEHLTRRLGLASVAVSCLLLLTAAGWTATQWLGQRHRDGALALADTSPRLALQRAERARGLDPFGSLPDQLWASLRSSAAICPRPLPPTPRRSSATAVRAARASGSASSAPRRAISVWRAPGCVAQLARHPATLSSLICSGE